MRHRCNDVCGLDIAFGTFQGAATVCQQSPIRVQHHHAPNLQRRLRQDHVRHRQCDIRANDTHELSGPKTGASRLTIIPAPVASWYGGFQTSPRAGFASGPAARTGNVPSASRPPETPRSYSGIALLSGNLRATGLGTTASSVPWRRSSSSSTERHDCAHALRRFPATWPRRFALPRSSAFWTSLIHVRRALSCATGSRTRGIWFATHALEYGRTE